MYIGIILEGVNMKITRDQFDEFWNQKCKYLKIKNAERLHKNLANKIEEFQDTLKLDDYVCGLKTGKESTRKVIVSFYEYLKEDKAYRKLHSELFDKHFYDYPFERQLEIAKFLHEQKTMEDIQTHFGIDARTARNDLQELEEGITVLGSTIQIRKDKIKGKYQYKTTLHPVFLPLNLTEVYALTVYLSRAIDSRDPNAEIIRNISDRIKSQLSDYAYKRLFAEEFEERGENCYLNDEDLARQRKGILMYLMKSEQPCRFIWEGNEYGGTIPWTDEEYKIRLKSGEYLDAKLEDVDFIIESLEYE